MNLNKILFIVRLAKNAFGHYKLKIITMAVLAFVGGALGGLSIGAIVPLFSFISEEQTYGTNSISNLIQEFFSFVHLEYTLITLIIIMVLLFIAKAVFLYLANYISAKIGADYERETRNRLLKKTLYADWPFLLEQKTGHLGTIIITDANKSSGILDLLSYAILATANLLAYSIVALTISATITFLTLGLGVVLFFIFKPLFYKIRKLSRVWAKSSKDVANQVTEYTLGSKIIKAASAEKEVLEKIKKYFSELYEARVKLVIYNSLQTSFQEPLALVLVMGIFIFSYSRPGFQFSSFVAVIYLVQKMFAFMQAIQGRLSGINETSPFLQAIADYTEQADKHRENDGTRSDGFTFKNILEFRGIKFAYAKNKEVLSGLNFDIRKGETVGLIGPSGAGKTTIVDLCLKFFTPSAGEILLDEKNISEINNREWRKNIGYVAQDMFLLNDTIENNIKFYDPSVSRADIIAAAKMANIYDTIQKQPDKFSAIVGERGVKFSVGQRQRIVLARALARKSEILILDEATSALDNESEALIHKTLENLRGKITIFIIAHRLSTVMSCDRLIALENGKMVEQGSPQELLKNKRSYFYKTYNIGIK